MIMRVNREVIILLLLICRCEPPHFDIANQFSHCPSIQSPSWNGQGDVIIITLIKFFMSSNACASWTESVLPCNIERGKRSSPSDRNRNEAWVVVGGRLCRV